MGRVGKQAQGEILPPHRRRKAPPAKRSRKVEPHGRRHRWNPANDTRGNMILLSRMHSWFRAIVRRSRMESEMDAELRFHIEAYADDLICGGVPRAEALRHARIEFGGLERAKEECRDTRGINFIESLIQDLRYGLRMLRKNPGFASTVILTLGLGIGLNSAIFTVASGFFLREPPVKDPPNVVMLTMVNPAESWDRNPVTPTEFSALRGQVHSFEGMAAVLIENLPLI